MNPSFPCIWMLQQIQNDAFLSSMLENRIFPDQAPEGTKNPCLVYQLLGEQFEEFIDAGPLDEAGFTIQLRAYADSRFTANQIREHLRILLQGACGKFIIQCEGQQQTLHIQRSFIDGYADTHEEATGDYGAVALWRLDY